MLTATVFLGDDNSVKLGDFGLSKLMQSHDFASTYVGTPFYMSPEICAAERYTLHSDIWSLGCIMYELCAKKPPFNAKTHFDLVNKIKLGRVDPLPSIYSPELQTVINNCLKTNPLNRPDTATLLNLPVVRLMRKEREVVELGRVLKTQEEQLKLKLQDLEARASSLATDKEKSKAIIESTVRREWEVKARLEIDRQIQVELENLQKRFEAEMRVRVDAEVQRQIQSLDNAKEVLPASPAEMHFSSVSTSADTDFPSTTDLSSLSLDSPTEEKSNSILPKKTTRTPFSRARTTYDSPMDVQMGEPSPMSIACLSLSPRRTAAATASSIPNSKNIFAAATNKTAKLHAHLLSPPSTSLHPIEDEEGEDSLPDLPSPTRLPSSQDPFKPVSRPNILRQKTAPSQHHRLTSHPALFPTATNANLHRPARIPSPPSTTTSSGSPTRKTAPMSKTAAPITAENDMFKAVMQRNLLSNNVGSGGQGGRTLVELAQARAGGGPSAAAKVFEKAVMGAMTDKDRDVVVWDPERDEMPSPFLVRGAKGLRRL